MANQATAITAAEAKRCRAVLESRLKDVVGVSREREELQIECMADPIDQVKSSTDREITIQRLDQQTHLIHDIQSVLVKIKKGAYGLCERCEEPIPRNRLEAAPWARIRVSCQSEVEAARHDGNPTLENAA